MNILEVNKYYYLHRGAERHFLDVIALFRNSGHKVAVFAMDDKRNVSREYEKYFVRYVGYNDDDSTAWQRLKGIGRLFWSFEARKKMTALLETFQPDIVHIHNMYHQLSPAILGPLKELRVPLVMTVHDYNLISPDKDAYYPEVGKHYFKFLFVKKYSLGKRILLVLKKYWEEWMGFYEKNIDHYIAPSVYVKNVLVRAGMPEAKITVVPHFIAGESQALREMRGTERPFALYCGSVSEEKHVNDLVAIFDTLRLPLTLAGTRADNFHVLSSRYVTVVGQQSKEALADLMRQAACVVSASPLPETFGLLVLEAHAYGKPFFGLRSGAFPEIITNGRDGYLGESTEALKKYIADFFSGKISFDAGNIQRDTYERFGEARYLQAIESLFRHLGERKKRQ
ncbi:MAG: glycosyltransferase [Candidatus Moraniibacteriota bacterium]